MQTRDQWTFFGVRRGPGRAAAGFWIEASETTRIKEASNSSPATVIEAESAIHFHQP